MDGQIQAKNPEIPGKNLLKVVKFQNLIAKCCIALRSLQIFYVFVLRVVIVTILSRKYCSNTIMRKFANIEDNFFMHYIFQPNFGILLHLKGSFREIDFFLAR